MVWKGRIGLNAPKASHMMLKVNSNQIGIHAVYMTSIYPFKIKIIIDNIFYSPVHNK